MKYFCVVDKQQAPAEYLTYTDDDQVESETNNELSIIKVNEDPNLSVIQLFGVKIEGGLGADNTFKEISILELDSEDFDEVRSKKGNLFVKRFKKQFFGNQRFAIITIEYSALGKSIIYPAFGDTPPEKVSVSSISFQSFDFPRFLNDKYVLNVVNADFSAKEVTIDKVVHEHDFEILVFGVGQGMCSLLRSEKSKFGVLFDVGAGTPVKRDLYIKKSINNELLDEIQKLDEVVLILSHLDSDHFRIMMWCSVIRQKITEIYIPSGTAKHSIVFKHSSIFNKVKEIDSYRLVAGRFDVEVSRTQPKNSSSVKNDNELITTIKVDNGEKLFLFPGDYVYKKMITDREVKISRLQKMNFDFVVAPHHGDSESSFSVPSAKVQNHSEVFFSAGNHSGYNHPTVQSIDAHKSAGFKDVGYIPDPNINVIKLLN